MLVAARADLVDLQPAIPDHMHVDFFRQRALATTAPSPGARGVLRRSQRAQVSTSMPKVLLSSSAAAPGTRASRLTDESSVG